MVHERSLYITKTLNSLWKFSLRIDKFSYSKKHIDRINLSITDDIDQNQLGKCDDFPLSDEEIQDAMADNPSGQGDELTPLILIRPLS